jgi:adenosine deaminase
MACCKGSHAGIVAFGLHGNEEGFPPQPFADVFRMALDGTDLLCTPHAGEIAPFPGGGPASVRDAIDHLGAHRILHGVLAIEDPKLVERLARQQICLDVCPSSNLLLNVFPSAAAHPLPRLLEAGVPCDLGSDDPLLFGPSLLDEFVLCREQMGLSDAQLAAMAKTSFRYSGAPQEVKDAGLAAVDAWLTTSMV